ncbi:hypothetical protein FQN60_002183, partial [Etheostoma spectabile]
MLQRDAQQRKQKHAPDELVDRLRTGQRRGQTRGQDRHRGHNETQKATMGFRGSPLFPDWQRG